MRVVVGCEQRANPPLLLLWSHETSKFTRAMIFRHLGPRGGVRLSVGNRFFRAHCANRTCSKLSAACAAIRPDPVKHMCSALVMTWVSNQSWVVHEGSEPGV
jgi:hypothetical protein